MSYLISNFTLLWFCILFINIDFTSQFSVRDLAYILQIFSRGFFHCLMRYYIIRKTSQWPLFMPPLSPISGCHCLVWGIFRVYCVVWEPLFLSGVYYFLSKGYYFCFEFVILSGGPFLCGNHYSICTPISLYAFHYFVFFTILSLFHYSVLTPLYV